jgi:superfamily II DNA or RNA helicase
LAHALLAERRVDAVIAVVPREHLKRQVARAMAQAGIVLDHDLSNAAGALAADVHGAVVTYQQVAAAPGMYARLVGARPRGTAVLLDEIHHAGDQASWGTALRDAFGRASFRVALSGTPFRSDGMPIPFVTYRGGMSVADFTYDYATALRDGGRWFFRCTVAKRNGSAATGRRCTPRSIRVWPAVTRASGCAPR